MTSKCRRGWHARGPASVTLVSAADLRAADEADDGFERHFHLETRRARFLAARLDLRIFRDRGGNRVGQLSCEPVHDVVHLLPSSRRRAGVPGRLPIEPAYTRAVDRDRAPDVFIWVGKCLRVS